MTVPANPDPLQPKAASTSYTLRRATPADAAQVSHLIGSTWAKFFAYSVTPQDLEDYLSGPVSVAQISSDIENPAMRFLVSTPTSRSAGVESGETPEIVGVAQLVLGTTEPCLTLPRPVELRRLYVSPEHHGGGAASSLVRGVEDLARGEGLGSMWLGVWEDNPRGKRFYEKMGFGVVGEHTFLVGQSVRRDWVMEKAL
ncbi:hypothetical protein EHS25_001498 [Saitozyma podzolica]|uniref:N-acetyltransferase domain-containing protein n=1 Tax=Saitozyma podzolica TaxID=1890683 RepID=A0A427YGU8_9TREE|nr:hypothetical protein EHS25_001498 [Saitozyma podzolica]